ncbi:sigma 54-interacting transcriptional regulator [Geotalea uraniireducens]|uniref:Sigma-54 specific transcriptional regulator, Fis family n=1 Tax=Geotalea uraniireducens (strain Rf4) TaxID=351605 RepID=A5GAP4_GEOUR|nr:sigma 54-interacting transcriptional regulator [Geotalea uraniireducens]ABQ25356.1 sigma-54 specific transcriptional regulator, Fis family [Geotalea uraniireducens Rf4]
MPRLSPRIIATVPATLDTPSSKIEMVITDLGLNGAYLRAHSPFPGKKLGVDTPVLLQYNLFGKGLFEHRGNIIRKDNAGYAVNFPGLDFATKRKLWEFIVDNLSDVHECPFCGESYITMPTTCKRCGWELNFNPPEYFNYYEKNCTIKKLHERLSGLDIEQLQKIVNFIDIDIAKVMGSEEIQEFVGTGNAMLEVFANIRKVAPTDLTVLVLGESGTGKELTAQAIHDRSTRKDKPFVAINCAAIPDNLLEAELFGYEKGAFTGAHISKKGKFEFADNGTIFLDEIGDMPPNLQAKLLRFLQDKIVERIGTVGGKKVNVRLIAATNRDLDAAIAEGKFRSDLYYRLDEFTINLPPVRERGEDTVILAKYFLNKFSREVGLTKTFTKDAADAIRNYDWPGNVREIINKVRRAIVMAGGKTVTPVDLLLDVAKMDVGAENNQLSDALAQIERAKIKEVLKGCSHNLSNAARMLGISRPTLYRRMKIYGID